MTSRRAACDPCRKAKLACGHERPICTRCTQSRKANACVYRASPFKRKQSSVSDLSPTLVDHSSRRHSREPLLSPNTPQRTYYPNPGYLGPTSHVAIFNHIFSDQDPTRETGETGETDSPLPSACLSMDDYPSAKLGAELTRQLLGSFDLKALEDLVIFWCAKGANLAVAEPVVKLCSQSCNFLSLSTLQGEDWHMNLTSRLLQNTARPLEYGHESTISNYSSQFLGANTRWETFGIFLSAAIRATMDILFFPSLYTTPSRNRELRGLLMRLIDCSLDICLSMDCLNDLQLILQYENFIIHSHVDGDHSYRYWRNLGDVITSTFALGYHENIESKPGTPRFLVELRKTVFARTYAADKNVSIFLGRPLRMSKRFCHFQVPACPPRDEDPSPEDEQLGIDVWKPDTYMSYRAETRYSALCASVKEEILELMFDRHRSNCLERASALQATADAHWNALPAHFRFEGSLKQSDHTPFERDFLISIRLNYLHITFLLRRILLRRLAEPDETVLEVAGLMLHLVVDAILLRDELVNSGTGLDWKIAYFGLPAAGVLLLAMLRQQRESHCPRVPRGRVLEDLTVLAAEVERGTLVRPEEPNYALLSKATQTIQRFFKVIHSEDRIDTAVQEQAPLEDGPWLAQLGQDSWDFEIGFWQGLVDHSLL